MTHSRRNSILFQILLDLRDKKLTVTGVRNEIQKRDTHSNLDKAVLRRWVNSKFMSLERKGIISRHKDSQSRKAYFLVQELPDETLNPLSEKPVHDNQEYENGYKALQEELHVHIMKAKTQASYIQELKRIKQEHPHLEVKVKQDIELAVDENCQILGKIKALETYVGHLGK